MKIGDIRVNTAEQNTIRQEVIMNELGIEKVFIVKVSGKNTDRTELQNHRLIPIISVQFNVPYSNYPKKLQ